MHLRLFAVPAAILMSLLARTHAHAASYVPMKLQSESFYKRWPDGPQGCFYWDDTLKWTATGSLAPGESFSFVPKVPTCSGAEMPVIMAWASWDASQLEITTVAPDVDGISDDPEQIGKPIKGMTVGKEANLCMFTRASRQFNYAITIKNVGSETAYAVSLNGSQYNGWPTFYYDKCSKADADRDGFNDSLEHVMGQLTYHGYPKDGTYPYDTFMGSNYLRNKASSALTLDEVDFFPVDFNDDGVVDQRDVDRLLPYLGQGTGVSIDRIGPNPGTANYLYTQAQPWRRYDFDGDGYVSVADRTLLQSFVGQTLPKATDTLPPVARVVAPLNQGTVKRGSSTLITVYAADLHRLEQVDMFVDGRLLCQLREGSTGNANNDLPHHRCWWSVPKRNMTHQIEVRARDASGNMSTTAITVNAR